MNEETAVAMINTSLIILVGFSIWYTKNLWSFLGLIFMHGTSKESEQKRCKR